MDIHETLTKAHEYHTRGNTEQAEHLYREILRFQPDNFVVYNDLGNLLQEKGQLDEAIVSYKKAITLNPAFAGVYFNLAETYQEKGQIDEAISYYQIMLQHHPNHAESYNNLGIIFQEKGQFARAAAFYRKAIALNPGFAEAYCNVGNLYRETGAFDDALSHFQKTILLAPSFALPHYNLGILYKDLGRLDDAEASYRKAIECDPSFAHAYNNLGNILKDQGKIDEVKALYRKAISVDPDLAIAHFNLATVSLLSGEMQEGWREYEWRWRTKEFLAHRRNFDKPQWDGVWRRGSRVLLYAEQGFGDTIHFIRYAQLMAQQGIRVAVQCQLELTGLLQNLAYLESVTAYDEQIPDFDFYCPLMSLPGVFKTTLENIPAFIPYLYPDSSLVQKWKQRVSRNSSTLKVGLVWAGGQAMKKDPQRSFPFETYLPLVKNDNCIFYSLQKGLPAQEASCLPQGAGFIDYMDEIHDFSDTAALIENLDLIISVDTAIVHLAGAIGKPVWTLLPFVPDWRWMLSRDDSPWYPAMRLFRQTSPGVWESVIEQIVKELAQIVSER